MKVAERQVNLNSLYVRNRKHLRLPLYLQQDNVMRNQLITIILTQYHVSKGKKVFDEPGVAAVLKVLKKLHDRMVMDPKNTDKITEFQKKAALQYIMFIKQKICGKIKGRECADGRNQRKYLTKDDTTVPNVASVALFLSCLINSMYHWEVFTVEISGASMQADMEDKTVHMKLEPEMADLLTKLDPKLNCKCVTNQKVLTVFYVNIKNPHMVLLKPRFCSCKI